MTSYKFIADCNRAHCNEIQKHMAQLGFEDITLEKTWIGDHYGIKRFRTDKEAEAMAEKIYKKYNTDKKLYKVTVKSLGR